MANLSADAIGKFVQEIDELRKTAEGTLIDQTQLKARFDAATAGLLDADGKFDPAAWKNLSAADKETREGSLTNLRKALGNWEQEVPIPPASIMYKRYASNGAIIALTLFALFGLVGDLYIIRGQWNKATSGKTVVEDKTPSTSRVIDATSPSPPTPSIPISSADSASAATPIPAASVTGATSTTTTANPAPGTPKVTGLNKPTEESVLFMVILLGALGGFLHLASSMANYVGNRQLLKSWIIYYVLIPFQGAALAPIVYLLLRVGVLNPSNPASGSPSPTDSLNLIGIYGFAALTGLFSKQAIEMMADVFATIFKRVNAKDSLEKARPGTE